MSLQDEVDIITHRLEMLHISEALVSDAYVRLRERLGAWGSMNTQPGGADRFVKTEAALDHLIAEYADLIKEHATLKAGMRSLLE